MDSLEPPRFRLSALPGWDRAAQGLIPGATIILRTRDRPLLLRRALESIRSQSFPH